MVCNKYICEEVYYKGIVSQNCEDWKIPICSVGSAKGRGNLLQRPRVASCLTLGNELSEETHMLTRENTILGRGEQEGKGTQDCSDMWLAALGFMVMGLAFGLSGQSF